MKKSSPYVMTSRQINIPYLLKIGEGKIAKIGKYLFDKDMTGIALFWGEGMEKMLGGRLKRGLDEHGIEILSEDTVSSIAVEDITAAAFLCRPVSKRWSASAAAKCSILPNTPHICCGCPISACRLQCQTTAFVRPLRR